jgi:PAS domain S-box-containing protein
MKLTKALRYTIIFALTGLVTTAIVFLTQQRLRGAYERNLPLSQLGDWVNSRVALAALQLEKIADGDQNVGFQQQVITPLTASKNLLQHVYDGKETELGRFEKIDNEETKALLKENIFNIEKLAEAATQRWQVTQQLNPNDSANLNSPLLEGISQAKKNYDAQLDKVQKDLQALTVINQRNIKQDGNNIYTFSWLSIALVFISFSVLSWLLYRLQHSSDILVEQNTLKLEQETSRVGTLSNFIEAVSAGNYNMELKTTGDDDNLTDKLITMRDKLKQNSEDDRKRNWSTTGLARIGEILRATTSSTAELYDNIIKFVVKYTESNQGGLFLLDDDNEGDRHLELVSCYAFERKKFLQKRVEIGDGLVGQCFLEGERIVLLEVPQEYISITSGLGGSNPNALLVIPMKVNDKIYGVIELASFNKYEDYEIELVEKLAESIASTISNVRVNETTRILLERTQQQAEEMKSQEEEIRQNMEELEATQEEMRRKQTILEKELDQSQRQAEILRIQEKRLTESQDTLQAIVDNIPRAIFWKDRDLRFMGCNKIFASVAGANSIHELIGKSDFDMAWSAQADAYRQDDMEVMRSRKAKLDIEEVNINSEGEESWVLTSKVPIVNTQNEVVAILGMFEDITARKRQEADISRKLQEREVALQELQKLKEMLESKK